MKKEGEIIDPWKELAEKWRENRELLCADIFNNAFSTSPAKHDPMWARIYAIRQFGKEVRAFALEAIRDRPMLATSDVVRQLIDELKYWEGEAYEH